MVNAFFGSGVLNIEGDSFGYTRKARIGLSEIYASHSFFCNEFAPI